MNNILYVIIVLLLAVIAYLYREVLHLRKREDYYISVDEENEKLKKQLNP